MDERRMPFGCTVKILFLFSFSFFPFVSFYDGKYSTYFICTYMFVSIYAVCLRFYEIPVFYNK